MSEIFHFHAGDTPLLVSVPHAGTGLSPGMTRRLRPEAATLPDTDWFVDRLWSFATGLGAGFLVARYSRYVVDLNRAPDDARLYSGPGTGLVPLSTFEGKPLYREGSEPATPEREARVDTYWKPYHGKLESELSRLRDRFGFAVLLDAHSIRHRVPRLFDGALPDLNLGSHQGRSAAPGLIQLASEVLARWPDYSMVLDGRFTGGFITRHYGAPEQRVHALQLEMAQRVYMRESPPEFDDALTAAVQPCLRDLVGQLATWRPGDD